MEPLWLVFVDWVQAPTVLSTAAGLAVLAVLLGGAERLFGGRQAGRRTSRATLTDLIFWFGTPLVSKAVTYAVLAAALGYLLGGTERATAIGRQPFWLQFLEVVVLADFIHYWTHRLFHRPLLWPMHAVHHSPTELDWLSSMRLHPLNDLATRACQALPILALGYDPAAVIFYVPTVVVWVIVSHTDLPWTFGPLRYLFVSPVFHQWHHSSEAAALDRNFAGIFSAWDLAFGTFHMPDGERPARYGVNGGDIPESAAGLLLHPIRVWVARLRLKPRNPANSRG